MVEQSCKQEVENLREEVVAVGNKVEVLENGQDEIIQVMGDVQEILNNKRI